MTPAEIQRLLPPNLEYPYFERANEFLFQPDATGFQLVNACWLMDIALLAYVSDEGFIRRQLEKVGLHQDPLFLGFEDILTDAMITQAPASGGGIHTGFARALEEVWNQLVPFVRNLGTQRVVWFTGHSLGGALATLAADRYAKSVGAVQGLYSFGSPRVGDERFVESFSPAAHRIVNGDDVVTTVPLFGPVSSSLLHPVRFYKHIGELKHIDRAGKIGGDDPRTMDEMMAMLRAVTSRPLTEELTQPLIDHAPVLYSELLWKNL